MFVITYNQKTHGVRVSVEDNEDAVNQLAENVAPGHKLVTVGKSFDLSHLPTPVLVNVYNEVSGETVKRFATREVGYSRVWKALKTLAMTAEPTKSESVVKASSKLRRTMAQPAKHETTHQTGSRSPKARTGVTAFIRGQIEAGKSNDEIETMIRDQLPASRAGKKEIAWVRWKLKKEENDS